MQRSSTHKRVFVGMSGGVDSSVAAFLLKKSGYAVTGVFIKTWSPEWMPCTWKEERLDALRVAVHLGIPLVTIDGEKEYKENVAEYMIHEYQTGRTPNPDFFCNNFIKFGLFYDYARAHGAEYVATGHYAQIKKSIRTESADSYELMRAADPKKDQSYFLGGIKKEQLSSIIFPIGHLKKTEVREIAHTAALPVAEKKDSQGLCFLGPINMEEFLSHYIETEEGPVLREDGSIIGKHQGAAYITLGQRHGFTITEKNALGKAWYVVSKDVRANSITVGEAPDRSGRLITLSHINWLSTPDETREYLSECRYHQKAARCKIQGDRVALLDTPGDPPTPGQICVLYDEDIIIGSGVIEGVL